MAGNDITLSGFRGPALNEDSTDQKPEQLRLVQGMTFRPQGAISRAPCFWRLWSLVNLAALKAALSISAADKGVCLRLSNEGHVFLIFFDCISNFVRACQYVGFDAAEIPVQPPTLTVTAGAGNFQVLWRGLSATKRWNFEPAQGTMWMGNGIDPNFIYTSNPPEFRRAGDQIRPFAPEGSAVGVVETTPADASYQWRNVLFLALEPNFTPISDETYKRGEGNNVIVDVVQGATAEFNSLIEGKGTWSEPYHYRVLCPGPTEDILNAVTENELVGWVTRDPNAQGIVSAKLVGASENLASDEHLFNGGRLFGGATSFDEADVFAANQVDICATYIRKGSQGRGFETAPSAIITILETGSQRIQVTVKKDYDHPNATLYDAIRIYVAQYTIVQTDQGWKFRAEDPGVAYYDAGSQKATLGFATESYKAFRMALEVPNQDGTYDIAPSLITGRVLDADVKIPPPCTMAVFMYGRVFMAGNTEFPMRAFYTQEAKQDAKLPEGVGLLNYIDIPSKTDNDALRALVDFRGELSAHSISRAVVIPSNFYEAGTTGSSVIAGAINNRCVVDWEDGRQLFLGTDFNLYSQSRPFSASQANETPVAALLAPRLGNYMQQFIDMTDLDTPHSFVDYTAKQWWLWMAKAGGGITAFCYDFKTQDVTGPFYSPALVTSTRLNQADSRVIGADNLGNLLVLDLRTQLKPEEVYDNEAGVTIHPLGTSIPDSAFSTYTFDDGSMIFRASPIKISTGHIYFTNRNRTQSIAMVAWNVVENSAGVLIITLFNEKKKTKTYLIGEVFGKSYGNRKVLFPGNPVRIEVAVICGDDKPFTLRDIIVTPVDHGAKE